MGRLLERAGEPPLKFAVLGSGAMARFWAARLALLNPWVVGQSPPPYRIVDGHDTRLIQPRHYHWHDAPDEPPDVVLLSIKWRRMPTAHDWIARHAPHSLVLCLMNGMGQEDVLADIPGITLALGTTTAAATRDDRSAPAIYVRSLGRTLLPSTKDPREAVLQHASLTSNWGWEWVQPHEMAALRWQKLIQNSIINPLTALADCPNGALPEHPLWGAAPTLIEEAQQVARAMGIVVPEDMLDRVATLLAATSNNLSSTVQDVRSGLVTEVEAINGYIVRQARQAGLTAPTHQALVTLLTALPAHSDPL